MNKYETVVGLEIHAHLKTESKMFCRCAIGPSGKDYKFSEKDEPNVRICPICTGQPGTLPVPNKKAIEDTILLGLALGSKIAQKFNFERKNYFYPDLPKAYQITSSTNPPVLDGGLEIQVGENSKFVHLNHIHLEEDAGKLTHDKSGDFSLVDLNRAGTPLLEIITEPELSSGAEAAEFMRNLQSILRYLGISDADMEKGQMRCDANISVRKAGAKELGTKVEVKNINSFKMVQKAIDYESQRQIEALEDGDKITQETRGWDESKGKTLGQRSKEFAHDYRYFPEPDLPPFETGKGTEFDPELINDRLPELPKEKKARFIVEYGLKEHDAVNLTNVLQVADYFEKVIEEVFKIMPDIVGDSEKKKEIARLINVFVTTAPTYDQIAGVKIHEDRLAELVVAVLKDEITLKIARDILPEMLKTGKSISELLESKGIKQISDEDELNKIVVQILNENTEEVEKYKTGKTQLFGFFVGQVMAKTKGQANPKIVNEILKKELK